MNHSEPQSSASGTGGGPPVFNGTYDTTSLLQEKRPPSPTFQKKGGILNTKDRKVRSKDHPKPHRPAPYFKNAIRVEKDDLPADDSSSAETPSSSGAEVEVRVVKKKKAPSGEVRKTIRSSGNTSPVTTNSQVASPVPVTPPIPPAAASAVTVVAATETAGTTGNIFMSPPPPSGYTSQTPLLHALPDQVPLHLIHPRMLPRPLLEFIQRLYLEERSAVITEEGAINQWAMLDDSRRIHIVELYGHAVAQAHAQARDKAFEAKIRRKPTRGSTRSASGLEAQAPEVVAEAPNEATSSMAAQVVSRSTSQGSISGYSTAPSTGAGGSSELSLNLEVMEDIVQDMVVAEATNDAPMEMIDIISSSASTSTASTSVHQHQRRNKGKTRAIESMDEDEADDECEMASDMPEDTSSTIGCSTPTPPEKAHQEPATSSVDAQLTLLLVRKIEALDQNMRSQAAWYKEQADSNRTFQEALLTELRNLRESGTGTSGAGARNSTTNSQKPTRINAALLKVIQRSAKARGVEAELTPEQIEYQQKVLMRSRVQGHLRGLLKIDDMKDLCIRHPTLTEEEVQSWENGEGQIVCTAENLQVDFERKWKTFSLNKAARRIILFTFRKKADAGTFALYPPTPEMLTDEYLGPILDQYMKTLRRAYREVLNPPDEEARKELLRRRAQNARMNTLYQTRMFVIIHMNYTQHSILFSRMVAANMSGDKTDGPEVTHPPVYRIIIAEWQSLALRTFLWTIDAKYLAYWAKPPKKRRTGGNPARHRVMRQESRTISGVAPIGLWRNCYNTAWLESLQEWEIELLEIVDEDYDFTLDLPATGSGSTGPSRRR